VSATNMKAARIMIVSNLLDSVRRTKETETVGGREGTCLPLLLF